MSGSFSQKKVDKLLTSPGSIFIAKNKVKYWNEPINQLYHPTALFKVESQSFVYSSGNLNITKFVPILLKEWFYLVEVGSLFIIDYLPNKICDFQKLEEHMWWLFKGRYEIICHELLNNSKVRNFSEENLPKSIINEYRDLTKVGWLRFICKKTKSLQIPGDDITKWTFGIITKGKRNDWVQTIIESIRRQKIPNYEIIICGTYYERGVKDIKYIPFDERDDLGWITKKKNLIVKNANYENICMLHDRMVLDEDWYKGMKKWGNCFENLGCQQLFRDMRVNDWVASHFFVNNKEKKKFAFESYVDYRDWYSSIWFMGQFNIFKKSILVNNQLWWDETLYYGEEDPVFSANLHKAGFIHRLNNLSKIRTLTHKYLNPTYIQYDVLSEIPRMKLNSTNAYLKLITLIVLKVPSSFGINLSFETLKNVRGRIYTFLLMLKPERFSYNQEWRKTIK